MIKESILLVGDTHSTLTLFDKVDAFFKSQGTEYDNSTFIHVGDVGIGFNQKDKEYLKKTAGLLKAHNCKMFCVRGNHDDPSAFGNTIEGTIFLVADNFYIAGWLFIGGAISPDKWRRHRDAKLIGYNDPSTILFDGENFNLELEIIKDIPNYTIRNVVTHIPPSFVPPIYPIKSFEPKGSKEANELECFMEAMIVSELYMYLAENHVIDNWYYGHRHKDSVYYCDKNIKFRCVKQETIQDANPYS